MFNFFKKYKIKIEIKRPETNNNNIIVPITWDILTNEQKIKIANIVLQDKKVNIMGCCGDIEKANLIECVGIETSHNRINFKFTTTDSFYKNTYFTERQIIDRWLHFNKYGNRDYSNLT